MQGFTKAFFNYNQIHEELENENDFYFIAFLNDKAVGYVRLKEEQSEVAEIKRFNNIELKRIYVLKEYHSQKIGAHLMNFALRFATERGYKLLWLGVWEHNERARAFYKKFGFEDTGHTHDFPIGNTPQTDSWFMKFLE
jgi:ribosomal protein S18 acetylase RimI-like enzyme